MSKQPEVFCETYLYLKYSLMELRDNLKERVVSCFNPSSEHSQPRKRSQTSNSSKSSLRISRSEEVGTTNSTPSHSVRLGSDAETSLSFQDEIVKTHSQRTSDASEPVHIVISAEVHAPENADIITKQPRPRKEHTGPGKKEPPLTDPQKEPGTSGQKGPREADLEPNQPIHQDFPKERKHFQTTRAVQTDVHYDESGTEKLYERFYYEQPNTPPSLTPVDLELEQQLTCLPDLKFYLPDEYDTRTLWSPEPSKYGDIEEIDVIQYREQSAHAYLGLSPELPGNLLLNEAYRGAYWSTSYPVRERSSEPCLPTREPRGHYRLSSRDTPRSQSPTNWRRAYKHPSRYRRHSSERPTMGRMNSLEDHERKIIIEFCHLLEKSKQLFNGLRELPQYGHKQWHAYFGKTFDVYTKLWKFQQQHRAVLDSKYGLKRWQIGEIASKIGQLYYHFYLRTSDTTFLNEAFSFYYAIRGRSYYTQACKEDKCELMVKKLRYYARFIVASLLLKKVHLVGELLRELDKQIIEYGKAYEPDDQNEWRIVADEVRTFIEVESVVEVTHPREYPCILSHRLGAPVGPSAQSALDRVSPMTMTLREAVIVGSSSTQLKFSEMSIDMFRIMQTLEREPHTDVNHLYDESPRQRNPPTPSAINNKGYSLDGSYNTGEAPHKQMLFKPSPNQIFLYMSSAIDDLPPNGVLLLYLSAEGLIVPNSKHPEEAGGYDAGGLITTSKADVLQRETSTSKDKSSKKESSVLYPGDLYPFTRRPLIVIVDSDNSYIFANVPRHFGQPLIILMSPIEQPPTLYPGTEHPRTEGSLFTLFLHDPLSAICLCCDIKRMALEEWERAQSSIDGYLKEAASLLSRMQNVYASFLSDDFLRLLILRYIFCETVLRMHRMFRGRAQRTRCLPTLPDDLFEHPILTRIVMDLALKLQVRGHFHDPAVAQRE